MDTPSLKRNYIYNVLFTTTNLVIPLLTFTYVAPIFKPHIFGKLAFAQSTVNYFIIVATAGIPLYGAREIARLRENPAAKSTLFWELLLINAGTTILTMVAFAATLAFIPTFDTSQRLLAIYGQMLIFNLLNVDWFFVGEEQYRNLALRSSISKALLFITTILLIKSEQNYELFAFIGAFSVGATSLVGYAMARPKISSFNTKMQPLRHLKPILVLFGSTVTASIYVHLDTVMLGFMASEMSVGLYAAAARISRIAVLMIISIGATTVPRVAAYLSANRTSDFEGLVQKVYDLMLFFSIPLTTFVVVHSPAIIVPLTQGAFKDAAPTLRISAFIIIIIGLSNFVGMQILFPAGKEKAMLISTLIAAIINVVLNSLLIPVLEHNGAALASVFAELSAFLVLIYYARGMLKVKMLNRSLLAYLVASLLAACVSQFPGVVLGEGWLGLTAKALSFVGVFLITTLALGDANTKRVGKMLLSKLIRTKTEL